MKKIFLFMALAASFSLQAQWTDDEVHNNFLANCSGDDGEIYTATNPITGDTYIQWSAFAPNGWVPWLQRLTFDGTPQWGTEGIHVATPGLASWSPGYAMAATTDGGVVTVFNTADGHNWAVKINADGTYPWGEQGITILDGLGGDRSEVVAGNDGGVWVLGCDFQCSYLQYINADGTMGPITTISDPSGYNCMFGQLTLSIDNNVLLTYEKLGTGYYTDKQIYVVGVTPNGGIISPTALLMSSQTFQSTYIHYAVPDGMGGGYAYIWHSGIGQAFNTYVFHFNELGLSTISDENGIPVHSSDPTHYYGNAYATVDPVSHDLIVAYEQTDASTQNQSRIYVNRITATGDRIWGEGILLVDYVGVTYSDILVDAFEDGSGFSVIYSKSSTNNPYFTTLEAIGMDMEGNQLWTKTINSGSYRRTVCKNTTGFHLGQNIVAWVNCIDGGLYGQNIAPDGTLGPVEPILPCLAPENFEGEYTFNYEMQEFGTTLSWVAPQILPLYYNLYRTDILSKETVTIEVPADVTSYYDPTGMGNYMYQLTAVYEHCESEFALTPDGEDHVEIHVTGIKENLNEAIITVLNIYNMQGQHIKAKNIDNLSNGIYILQGLTETGQMVSHKVIIDKK